MFEIEKLALLCEPPLNHFRYYPNKQEKDKKQLLHLNFGKRERDTDKKERKERYSEGVRKGEDASLLLTQFYP